ncbi:hypothetical protein HU200_016550 [Digitaria exilis]|uniref:Uncharacterized protein n=1 Tax=Digitaria exilis TaxID=1010633 RepID=A0A835KIA6_9POAL|nr:hypothetical protein HU200_016550 [Digitaria exilis]
MVAVAESDVFACRYFTECRHSAKALSSVCLVFAECFLAGTRHTRCLPNQAGRAEHAATHLLDVVAATTLPSTPFRAPACTGERESRSPEPVVFEILHRERANKVFGKRYARLLKTSSPRLVLRPSLVLRRIVVCNINHRSSDCAVHLSYDNSSSTPFRAPACTGERESRSPEPVVFEILHRERANKVFGKRYARLLKTSSPRLVLRPSLVQRRIVVCNINRRSSDCAVHLSYDNSSVCSWQPVEFVSIRCETLLVVL